MKPLRGTTNGDLVIAFCVAGAMFAWFWLALSNAL